MIAAEAMALGVRLVSGAVVQWQCDPESRSPRIYFANHSSHLDFVVIWSALPPRARARTRPVAGREYWERTRLRRYVSASVFRAVLVDRGAQGGDRAANACESICRMAEALDAGDSLIVFPEGTRSESGGLNAFKSGLYHLSRARPDAELIPVHLENLNRILPKGETLPVPMIARVVFGTRFDAAALCKDAFLAAAREELLRLGAAA